MAIRVIMDFGMDGTGPKQFGWSEIHWWLGVAPTLDAAVASATALGRARVGLLGSNGYLKAIRLSDDAVKRDSLLIVPRDADAHTTSLPSRSTWDLVCDQPNAAVLMRILNIPVKRKNFYLAGIPDLVIRTSPAGPSLADPTAIFRFNVYSQELTGAPLDQTGTGNQWGFRGRKITGIVNTPILDWGSEGNGGSRLVAFVDQAVTAMSAGQIVQVSGVLMRPAGIPKPTGQWRIQSVLAPSGGLRGYVLRGTEGFDPASIDVPGNLIQVDFDYFQYTRLSLAGQTTRKRGVGSIRPRGRSSVRQRRLA